MSMPVHRFLAFTPEVLARVLDTPFSKLFFIASYIHTPRQAFGKIMSTVKLRHAISATLMHL